MTRMEALFEARRIQKEEGGTVRSILKTRFGINNIQADCVYGYVLPDHCRYWNYQGCPCGAYPPIPPIINR